MLYISPLKALAVDVERNLRAPLAGISNMAAAKGMPFHTPAIAVRTGDTPAAERAKFQRAPADILITTPESLFLLLTSNAHESLKSVETVIIDEIHAMVSTKRGAHLALSLERLERIVAQAAAADWACRRRSGRWTRSRGISAGATKTSRPQDHEDHEDLKTPSAQDLKTSRPTSQNPFTTSLKTITRSTIGRSRSSMPARRSSWRSACRRRSKTWRRWGNLDEQPSGPASRGPVAQSIWSSIHPRLVELIRSHRSTLLFVNSRRLAERLAGALNEIAGEPLVRAHHGSLARAQRTEIEDLLKSGHLRALVATSSLELGIDMGAIDLVIQIEAPPSVASGLQRIGRAGHSIGAGQRRHHLPEVPRRPGGVRRGHRGDAAGQGRVVALSAQPARRAGAAAGRDDVDGALVGRRSLSHRAIGGAVRGAVAADLRRRARHAVGPLSVGRIRRAAAARHVGSRQRHGDGAAGRQARGDRQRRHDSRSRACTACSCPAPTRTRRASASSTKRWCSRRAPARRSCSAPRPGASIRSRTIACWSRPRPASRARCRSGRAKAPAGPSSSAWRSASWSASCAKPIRRRRSPRSQRDHGLDALAAANLLNYLDEQFAAAGAVPDDRTIVIERSRDDLGDWRVAVLSPFGSRVHAPWAMAATARIRDEAGIDVEVMWSDDGFVVRYPDGERPPDTVVAAARSRRGRAAGGAAARIDGDVLGALPRSRRPRAAAAPPPARRARAAVAAAQARLGSARGGGAIRIVPDHSRDLSRVPARHLRLCRR